MRHSSFWVRGMALAMMLSMVAPQMLQARVKPSSGWNLVSKEDEVKVGQEASGQVSGKLPLLSDSDPVTIYVKRLGANLVAHAPGDKWPYNFHVVNQKEINAFAMPGGPIYINLGTIQAADNEAQLAGVMAHEMSHVIQRHSTRAYTKQMAASMPLQVLGGLLGRGIGGQLAQVAGQFAVGSYFLKNSRQAEREADLLGTDIMYDSGYDPHQMSVFFERLEKEGGASNSRTAEFFSDHPNPGNRAAYVSKEVSTLPGKKYQSDSSDFRTIKTRVAGMKPLTAQEIAAMQKQGGTIASAPPSEVMPSSNTKTFEHDVFRISYPENWQVAGDSSSAVRIAPKAGVSADVTAYGAIIGFSEPEQGRGSLDEATHQLIDSLRQSNPDMKVIGHDEDIRVNGVAGKSVDFVNVSPIRGADGGTQRERDWLVTLQRKDGSLLYIIFISTEKDFDQMRPAFEKMLRSLKLK